MAAKNTKKPVKMLPAPSLAHSGVRVGTLALWLRFRRFASTPIHLVAIGAGAYLLASAAFTVSFFVPRSVNFSFAEQNCFTSPTLLPNLVAKDQGETFAATPEPTIVIAGYPLYSHRTCIHATNAPREKTIDTIHLRPLGAAFAAKKVTVSTKMIPSVAHQSTLSEPVATKDPLVFGLSEADNTFTYRLIANDQTANCTTRGQLLECDTATLQLEQSASYALTMQRLFNGKFHGTVFEQPITTVGSVQLVNSSIAADQTVFDVPTQLTLTFNKDIKTLDGVELSLISEGGRQAVPITTTSEGATITAIFKGPLARSSSFELTIKAVVAPDGGHLPEPFVLPFTTSGGPKVQGVNVGSYKVSTTGNITITFDSGISTSQNLAEFIKFDMSGASATITASGNRVTIKPSATLPQCTRFTVRVLDGLQNEAGIAGGSAWSFSSRTICQSIFSIGTSVQGRSIVAYRFGSGSSTIVFVGGTHGNEQSSVHSLNSFVDNLERNYDNVPAHRTIVVIPNLNPDAYAKNQRTNANNVDLNRNFAANNWKQGVTMPGGSFNPNGGGNAPLSEPESKALADYVLGVSPRLVLTYHAAAGVVMPNDAGDSDALAKIYDQKSNLGYEPASQTDEIFAYDTTGSFEEWLYDKHNIPTLLIELWTKSSNEYSKNQNAMWHMVSLP